jgi:Insulinase (Peptidase family M16)
MQNAMQHVHAVCCTVLLQHGTNALPLLIHTLLLLLLLLLLLQAASVGLLVKAGTRDESLAETGATLLLQRLAFKSTTKRSSLRFNR